MDVRPSSGLVRRNRLAPMSYDAFDGGLSDFDDEATSMLIELEGQQVDPGLAVSAKVWQGALEAVCPQPWNYRGFKFSLHVFL